MEYIICEVINYWFQFIFLFFFGSIKALEKHQTSLLELSSLTEARTKVAVPLIDHTKPQINFTIFIYYVENSLRNKVFSFIINIARNGLRRRLIYCIKQC